MADTPPIFGTPREGVAYRPRRAAYAVVLDADSRVAVVRTGGGPLFLPGGGGHPGETPQQTVTREVREECGRTLVIGARLGDAVQFFEAGDQAFEMAASFFTGTFAGDAAGPSEHELLWVAPDRAVAELFHACHVWALGLARSKRFP